MSTYILTHNPSRKPEALKHPQNPAKEIVDSIRAGKRAMTNLGGWNVTRSATKIEPKNRLFFYRTMKGSGIFAVGRALYADDRECREMRVKTLQGWYPDADIAVDKLRPPIPGLAAYTAPNWEKKRGRRTTHINAEWDIVVAPGEGRELAVLVECDFWDLVDRKWRTSEFRWTGTPMLDNLVDGIYAKCKPESEPSRFNAEWDVVDCPQRGRIFIRRVI